MTKELPREVSGFYLSSPSEVWWIAESVLNMSRSRVDGTISSWLLYFRNLYKFPYSFLYYLDAIMDEMRKHGRHLVQYFCRWKSATVTSFSQLHQSRNCGSRRSLDQVNLHFLALYTRWLIKKAKKCEELSRFFVGMENFTLTEMRVGEK